MKRLTQFEDVNLGEVFYVPGGVVRSYVKLTETEASPSWPVPRPHETEAIVFEPTSVVAVDTDYNVCDDTFIESAIRDSSMRFDFSRALYLLKSRDVVVTRGGWELQGQPTIFLTPGRAQFDANAELPLALSAIPSYLYRNTPERSDVVIPVLCFKFRDGRIDVGWTPTTLDLMAEDWYVPHLPKKGYAIHADPILPL